MNLSPTIDLFGMRVNPVTMHEAVETLLGWAREPLEGACKVVVTPNVDHAVMFATRPDLREAYASASLVLADGAPLVAAARLLGKRLPGRVAGSDLTPRLLAAADPATPLRVFLLGAGPGVAERAAEVIRGRHAGVQVVGTHCPPLGFEKDPDAESDALRAVAAAAPDVLIVGLGAPKQELWVHRRREALRAKVVLCVGATIDFLAGEKRRAPRWMRTLGLEWAHRLASEPKRLAARYARDAWVFPQLVWREWRQTWA